MEGRLIDEDKRADPSKTKRKFSSFFKSLVGILLVVQAVMI